MGQETCKPSSVPRYHQGGDHLSRPDVTVGLKRPTRGQAGHLKSPYLALLQVRFTRRRRHRRGRELLPHDFTLTSIGVNPSGRCVSVALSVGLPRLGVTQHPARWSSDFPPQWANAPLGRPPSLLAHEKCSIVPLLFEWYVWNVAEAAGAASASLVPADAC